MAYWRMQLHPAVPGQAVRYCVESLAAGYIGLDFDEDVGDLTYVHQEDLPSNERDYWLFAHKMERKDIVLIMAHHFPFALARVKGDYNYIRKTEQRLGLWFRHFREVEDVRYYADFVTNASIWQSIQMTGTIQKLHSPESESFKLIEKWLHSG